MEKRITFSPAFHKIHEDPTKNYGVGSVTCRMVLTGDEGAVQFVFSLGMYLPQTYKYWESKGLHNGSTHPDYMGYDVGYHSLTPQYEGQEIQSKSCEYLDGKPCYYDGSSLLAEEYMNIFVEKGEKAIWEMLEAEYKERFAPQQTPSLK